MDGMSQGRRDKCLGSLVMSGDRSPAGMISAAVIDSQQAQQNRHAQLGVPANIF